MSKQPDVIFTGIGIAAADARLSIRDLLPDTHSMTMDSSIDNTYLAEFDITNPAGRMPNCCGKEYDMHLANYVMLRDPNQNEVEVQVERRGTKMFLKNGWFGIKDFYDLDVGAWVGLTFFHPTLMYMTIYSRFEEEIKYPTYNPPIISKLDRRLCELDSMTFVNGMVKVLTAADVYSGYMVLPWVWFCKDTFPHTEVNITVVDYVGFYWKCSLRFADRDGVLVCTIGGEWGVMCRARNLVVGQGLLITVAHETDNRIIYLRHAHGPTRRHNRHVELIKPTSKIISKKSAEVLNSIIGSSMNAEVASVRNNLLKLNSYFVEFEATSDKTRMPACFVREYGIHVDEYVMLRDPNYNMLEVRLDKKRGKVYIRDGWNDLKKIYNIDGRAWIKLTYTEPNLMFMSIRNSNFVEIQYPRYATPPTIRLMSPTADRNLIKFRSSDVHILTSSDIRTGVLLLSWSSFCRDVYVQKNNLITLIDQGRFNWKCTMDFVEENNRLVCKIGGDWGNICALRKFRVGDAVKLAVSGEIGCNVVYLKHVPLQCTHMSYIQPPTASINAKYVFQVNHYLVECPIHKDTA